MMIENKNRRRYFDIGKKLEEQLYSGRLQAGKRLPSERELSETFNTSRSTIREAIIMLELMGLVVVKPGAGIFFVDSPEVKSLSPNSEVGPFELLQARQVVECQLVGFAASQISLKELKLLRDIIVKQQKAVDEDSDEFEYLDQEFHLTIARATQNRILIDQMQKMWDAVRTDNPIWSELNHKHMQQRELKLQWLKDHKQIFLALQRRNSEEARNAMWNHIETSRLHLIKLASWDDQVDEFDDVYFMSDL